MTSAAGLPKENYLTFSTADGTGDYVQINNAQAIGGGGAVTVSAWVKVDVNNANMTFVAKGRSGLESWVLRRMSNNRMSFSVRNTAGVLVSADSPSNFGNDLGWHHLAGVYNGSTVSIYLDGSSAGTISRALTGGIRDNTTPICFGVQTSGSGCATSTFRGSLDDVQIWDAR